MSSGRSHARGATLRAMHEPLFRFVCTPTAIAGAPTGWAAEMLSDGHMALLADDSGHAGIDAVAHELNALAVPVVRTEQTAAEQERTIIAHAASLALVWVGPAFSDEARKWAHDRGPMTLLVEVDGALPDDERRRIERFVALLGRQAE